MVVVEPVVDWIVERGGRLPVVASNIHHSDHQQDKIERLLLEGSTRLPFSHTVIFFFIFWLPMQRNPWCNANEEAGGSFFWRLQD
jgi:hypothetical protein